MRSAARRKLGSKVEVDVAYNDDLGEMEVFEFKEVVESSLTRKPKSTSSKPSSWTLSARLATSWALRWTPPTSAVLPPRAPNRSSSSA
ncbi:hypothetical protein DFAR_1380005 [Desulfarculales bacterium]